MTAVRHLLRTLRAVRQDLRAHPLHQVLSAASLSIGIIAIVLTVIAGDVARDVFLAKEEQRTARAVTYRAEIDGGTHLLSKATRTRVIRDVRDSGGVAVFVADVPGGLSRGDHSPDAVTLHLYDGDQEGVRRLPLLHGRRPSGDALPAELVVNPAAQLNVGDTVALRAGSSPPEVQARVAAVIADGDDQPAYHVPWAICDDLLPCTIGSPAVLLHGPTTKDGYQEYLRRFGDLQAGPLERYDSVEGLAEQLAILQVVFAGCGALALLVSCAGLLNLGLATIRHRSRELAIRRAIGARRSDLLRLVLGSAVAVGIAGSLFAIGLVWAATAIVVPRLIDPATGVAPPAFPVTAVLIGVGVGVTVSLLGAAAPALVASRVDLAAVLRE